MPSLQRPPSPYWASDCGQAVVYLGNCLDVMPHLERGGVRLLWTDPPYGHNNLDGDLQSARVNDQVIGARVKAVEPISNDGQEEMRSVVSNMLKQAVVVLNPVSCCCCCCGGGGPLPTFAWTANKMDSDGLTFFHAVVWDKSGRGNGMGWRYRRNYEFVMVSHVRGGSLFWTNDAVAVPNVVRFMPVRDRQHPNEKPVELVEHFIELHTVAGDVVLDPFMGGGTTGVACIKSGRSFIGVELDKRWCDLAIGRIQQALIEHGSLKLPGTIRKKLEF